MIRWVLAVLGLVVTVGGAAAWHWTGRLDRHLAQLEQVPGDAENLAWLAAQPADPRITAAFAAQVLRIGAAPLPASLGYEHPVLEAADAAFKKHGPAATEPLVDAAVRAYARFGKAFCLAWFAQAASMPRTQLLAAELVAFAAQHPLTPPEGDQGKLSAEVFFNNVHGELQRRGWKPVPPYTAAALRLALATGAQEPQAWLATLPLAEQGAAAIALVRGLTATDRLWPLVSHLSWLKPPLDDEALAALLTACARAEELLCAGMFERSLPGAPARLRRLLDGIGDPWTRGRARMLVVQAGLGELDDVRQILEDAALEPDGKPPDTDVAANARAALSDWEGSHAFTRGSSLFDREAIAGFGKRALPQLKQAWTSEAWRTVATAGAVLAKLDPLFVISTAAPLLDEPLTEEDDDRAIPLHKALGALAEAPAGDAVDFFYMRALSSTDPRVAECAANTLTRRLKPEPLIDAVFRYLARKNEFKDRELDVYRKMLTRGGTGGSPAIVRNLDALAAAAKGPERVFWIHKVVGLQSLAEVGDEHAYPVLQRFAKDPGSYLHVETSLRKGDVTREETRIGYRDLASRAATAISGRSGVAAPDF